MSLRSTCVSIPKIQQYLQSNSSTFSKDTNSWLSNQRQTNMLLAAFTITTVVNGDFEHLTLKLETNRRSKELKHLTLVSQL